MLKGGRLKRALLEQERRCATSICRRSISHVHRPGDGLSSPLHMTCTHQQATQQWHSQVTVWMARHELSHVASTRTAADVEIGGIAGRMSVQYADLWLASPKQSVVCSEESPPVLSKDAQSPKTLAIRQMSAASLRGTDPTGMPLRNQKLKELRRTTLQSRACTSSGSTHRDGKIDASRCLSAHALILILITNMFFLVHCSVQVWSCYW